MIKKVAFFASPAQDTQRAGRFYKEVLGLGPDEYYEDMWSEVQTPDGNYLAFDKNSAGPYLALEVDNIATEIERLKGLGVVVVKDVFDTGVCKMAFIKDSEGNVLALHEIRPDRE